MCWCYLGHRRTKFNSECQINTVTYQYRVRSSHFEEFMLITSYPKLAEDNAALRKQRKMSDSESSNQHVPVCIFEWVNINS